MRFTFGIITGGSFKLPMIVKSIRDEVADAEIIVVGGESMSGIVHIPFDENVKPRWISKKKNLITQNATNENIVYMHDYLLLSEGWYEGFLKFGNEWDVCMNVITNKDGTRYRDWVTWPEDYEGGLRLVDYSFLETEKMYISGAYWVAKKWVMEAEPLNEDLCWGQGEDVEWSKRIRTKYNYVMNTYSEVRMLKQKVVIAT